jgi:hypothetical protein
LNFWASAEVFQAAFPAMDKARRCVGPFLNTALARSSLATLEGKLRYVPIVMPEGMRQRYPARSKLRKKERVYDCAPQLNYDVFVEGTFADQLQEYLRGIAESAPHLAGLGATPEQIEDFNKIMATAAERILAERPDQTRH